MHLIDLTNYDCRPRVINLDKFGCVVVRKNYRDGGEYSAYVEVMLDGKFISLREFNDMGLAQRFAEQLERIIQEAVASTV